MLTAPLVFAMNPIRRWLDPAHPLGRIALRTLLLLIGFIVYSACCLWLSIWVMRQIGF